MAKKPEKKSTLKQICAETSELIEQLTRTSTRLAGCSTQVLFGVLGGAVGGACGYAVTLAVAGMSAVYAAPIGAVIGMTAALIAYRGPARIKQDRDWDTFWHRLDEWTEKRPQIAKKTSPEFVAALEKALIARLNKLGGVQALPPAKPNSGALPGPNGDGRRPSDSADHM